MQLILVLVGYCGAAAVSFWAIRCCGYRLTRDKPANVQVATTLDTVSPRYHSALLPMSVLGLLFVVLLIPAWHLVGYRRAHASEFEWRRRGVAVLFEDGQVTYARLLNGGVHRDSISNQLLEDLSKAPDLRRLEVSGSAITDGQLEMIGKASSLETLNSSQTSIGDAGIQHLVNLDKFRHLTLTGSRVTAEGIQQLRVALPDCDIQPGSGRVQPARATVPTRNKVGDQLPE